MSDVHTLPGNTVPVSQVLLSRSLSQWMLAVVIVSAVAVGGYRFVGLSLASLQFPYALDYGEGIVLDVSLRLAGFQNIYPADVDAPPWFIANYPPVYYALRAGALSVGDPVLWPGRLLCQFSAIAVAVLIGLVTHRMTSDRTASVVAALTFLTIPFVVVWSQFDRVDMPALLFSWLGLWSLTSAPTRHPLPLAILCFVASSYTRQTAAIAALVAGYLWLAHQRQWRRAHGLIAGVIGVGLLAALVLTVATSGGFVFHTITATASPLSLNQLLNLGERPLVVMPLLLLIAAGAVAARPKSASPEWTLIASYVVAAAVMSLTVAKVGSYINYFLDLSAACALATGLWINRLRDSRAALGVFAALLSVQMMAMARASDITYGPLLARLGRAAEYARLESLVHRTEGPILADEALALSRLAGRDVDFHPFAMSQLARAGRWNPAPFIDRIGQRRYSLVLLRMPKGHERVLPNLWTPEMGEALLAHYERDWFVPIDDRAVIAVYRPRR